ncbi:hypothetical protein EX895_001015 [Sporisorium graminicola]|uniref:Pentacotripeptide-repeat region of PRORP domain-containing protein n=1 Tax=Sporisorium graminicola TaxID=280036 RepID=A0A4U7L2H7_9BASI|nr:hypothetical protein EX895_001015 [Sporisorium graminicola]TKY91016.1 hypothetical protein EX895_001015 [Sporisorium graminicola]
MLAGPGLAANAGSTVLYRSSKVLVRAQAAPLEALPPPFLCPVIESSLAKASRTQSTDRPSSSSSSSSSSLVQPGAYRIRKNVHLTARFFAPVPPLRAALGSPSTRRYSSRAATASAFDVNFASDASFPTSTSPDVCLDSQNVEHPQPTPTHREQPSGAPPDWRRKFPKTHWRREIDFNRYSPPLRRQRNLPEDAPALYEDEIKASAAWLPDSQWTLSVPEDYPLTHELFLVLDSLDDISHSRSDPDCASLLLETVRQARERIWANPQHPLGRSQDRDVALYLAGKVAETYVKLDAEASMDRLIPFLDYVQGQISALPLECFHALAARAGIARRYDAVLKICQVALLHHGGKADAELLHLRLRALVAQSKDVDLSRYWDLYAEAGATVPRKTFDLLLRTHVRRQDVEQLNEVLEAMPKHGHEVDAKAWLTILRGFQGFRPTLATMLRRDAKIVQSPTLNVVNQLLLLLSKELDVDGALMVLRIFRIPSIPQIGPTASVSAQEVEASIINGPSPQPNVQTYAVLTHMFGRLGRGKEALGFFQLALSASTNRDGSVCTAAALQQASSSVMRAYCNTGHPVRAMWFATAVLGLPFFGSAEGKSASSTDYKMQTSLPLEMAATTTHYRILLKCASAIGSPDAARRIVVHLLQHGYTIDEQVLRGLARLIFSTIDRDALESIRVIRRLLPRQGKDGTISKRNQRLGSLSDLLQHLGTSDRVVLASQHATSLMRDVGKVDSKPKPKPRRVGDKFDSLASSYTKDELRDWLIQDSSSLFRGVSSTHDDNGDAPALAQDLSQPLSPEAYAMRIRVYAVVRRDYESAQKVYHAMLANHVKPTMMHIAPLIEGLTAVGKLGEAQQLKRNAKEVTGLEPTLRIHTALIRAYVRAGDSNAARKEIQELTQNGYEIDDTIANLIEAAQSGRGNFALVDRPINERDSHSVATRFHALMRMRRYLAAQEMLQSALDSGMRSDKVLHDLVRRSVSYVDNQHAKALGRGSAAQVQIDSAAASDPPAFAQRPASGIGTAKQTQRPQKQHNRVASEVDGTPSSHVFELAQAVRLARANRERITRAMQKTSEVKRKQMKEHRKKVISLILDFADGKLHDQARKSKN